MFRIIRRLTDASVAIYYVHVPDADLASQTLHLSGVAYVRVICKRE